MQIEALRRARNLIKTMGVRPTTALYVAFKVGNRLGLQGGPVAELHSEHARHGLLCRAGTSDVDVFTQIFVHREYRCLDHVRSPSLILDCGANVGYSSAYFLSRFPGAYVVAVEPDPGNFAMLERNLAPYGARARAVRSAVWSHAAGLAIAEEKFGDGREWAIRVREARPGERPAMVATDVPTLLAESGYGRIAILKVDIEGSERVVFGGGSRAWLDRVDNIVIELHGEECAEVFHDAIAGRGFALSRCEELTVCLRPSS